MKKYRVFYNSNAGHYFQQAAWQQVATVEANSKEEAVKLVREAFWGKDNAANIDVRFSSDIMPKTPLRAEIDK